MRLLKVGVSERSGEKAGQRCESQRQPSTCHGPRDKEIASGWSATPSGQTGRPEAAVQPEWPAHMKAEPEVRGRREVVLRVAEVEEPSSP